MGNDGNSYSEGYLQTGEIPQFKYLDNTTGRLTDLYHTDIPSWENNGMYVLGSLDIKAIALPLYEGAAELAAADVLSGSSMRGRQTLEDMVEISPSVPSWLASLCFDAETSGGILACVPSNSRSAFEGAFPEDCPPVFVGEVVEGLPCVRLG